MISRATNFFDCHHEATLWPRDLLWVALRTLLILGTLSRCTREQIPRFARDDKS
jgi:hypothetical protein